MISEIVCSILKSNWRSGLWFALGLAVVGIASFFEKDGWQSALRIPLSLLTFAVLLVTVTDFLMLVFGRTKLGQPWYIFVVASGALLCVLSFFGNPLPLVLLAFLISFVLLCVGLFKSK